MNNKQLAGIAECMDLFKKIHETSQDVFYAIDKQGSFIFVSPSVLAQRGFTPEEVMARPAMESICAEDRPQAQQMFTLGLEIINKGLTRLPAGKVRLRQPHKNGQKIWTEVISEFFFNEDREFLFVLGMSRSIEPLVAAEQEIARLQDLLRQRG